jgi:hypothetical protein
MIGDCWSNQNMIEDLRSGMVLKISNWTTYQNDSRATNVKQKVAALVGSLTLKYLKKP